MPILSVQEGITEEHLADIYSDPYITKVGHDHFPCEPIDHPCVTYLTAKIDDEFAGAFMAVEKSEIEIDGHSFLKKSSVKYSRDLGHEFLNWAFTSRPILRVTAYITDGFGSAKNYCLKSGMKYEGFRRDACVKDGVIKGVHILGITRRDWVEKWDS